MATQEHRLKRYDYKAWCIERRTVTKKGEWSKWIPFKYPGNMRQGIEGMLDISLAGGGGEFVVHNADELLEAIENATSRLETCFGEGQGVLCVTDEVEHG